MNSSAKIFVVLCCFATAIVSMEQGFEYEPTGTVFSTTAPIFLKDAAPKARQFVRQNLHQINQIEDIAHYADIFAQDYQTQHPEYPAEFLNLVKNEIYRTILSSKMKIESFIQQAANEATKIQTSSLKKNIPELVVLFKQKHNIPQDEAFDQIVDTFESKLQQRPASRSPQQSPRILPTSRSLEISEPISPLNLPRPNSSFDDAPLLSPSESTFRQSQENTDSAPLSPGRSPRNVSFQSDPYHSQRAMLSDQILKNLQLLKNISNNDPQTLNEISDLLKETQIDAVLGKLKKQTTDPITGAIIPDLPNAAAQRALNKMLKYPHSMYRLTDEQLEDTNKNLADYAAWMQGRPDLLEKQRLSKEILQNLNWLEDAMKKGNPTILIKIFEILKAAGIDTTLGNPVAPVVDATTGQTFMEHPNAAAQRALTKIFEMPNLMSQLSNEQISITHENLVKYKSWLKKHLQTP